MWRAWFETAIGLAMAVVTDGEAGPAAMVSGIGVLSGAGGKRLAGALVAAAMAEAFAGGAAFAHLWAGDEREAAFYRSLGATEVPGFRIQFIPE